MYGDGPSPPLPHHYQFLNPYNINWIQFWYAIEFNSDMNYPELVEYFRCQLHVIGLQSTHTFVRLGYKVGSSHNNPPLLQVQ